MKTTRDQRPELQPGPEPGIDLRVSGINWDSRMAPAGGPPATFSRSPPGNGKADRRDRRDVAAKFFVNGARAHPPLPGFLAVLGRLVIQPDRCQNRPLASFVGAVHFLRKGWRGVSGGKVLRFCPTAHPAASVMRSGMARPSHSAMRFGRQHDIAVFDGGAAIRSAVISTGGWGIAHK